MKQLDAQEIGTVAAQLLLGAGESVELMGFLGEPLFDWQSGINSDDIMALLDDRLPARAVVRTLDRVVSKLSGLVEPEVRIEEFVDRSWRIRIPSFIPPAHLLIVDRYAALYADLAWTSAKNPQVYLVEEAEELQTLLRLFEAAWSADSELLYRDPFGGFAPAEEKRIITSSALQWQLLIDDLAGNPARLQDLPHRRFEELVAELLDRDGMAVHLTPPQKDGGRDILAFLKTPAGEHLFYVECKRYSPDNPVGVRLVRELFGVVEAERATAGLLVTTSRFTRGAIQFRESIRHRMSFKDQEVLMAWLKSHSQS